MKKTSALTVVLFCALYAFAQTEFLDMYGVEKITSEKLTYDRDGFLPKERIDDKNYEECRIFFYKDFFLSYYMYHKKTNEHAVKLYGHLFVTGEELWQNFDTYKIDYDNKQYLALVVYTWVGFLRIFYIFDITDKNNVLFYKKVSHLVFSYQQKEDFFGVFKNKLCFFSVTDRFYSYFDGKNNCLPLYYVAPYVITNSAFEEYADDIGRTYRIYFDFDSDKGVYNIQKDF